MATPGSIVDKISKLLEHAESANKIGSQAEAETFMAKAQELMIRHKLEMSDVDFARYRQEDEFDQQEIEWEAFAMARKAQRCAWIEALASVICYWNFCTFLVVTGTNRIVVVGRQSNRETCVYLIGKMARIASEMSEREYVKYFYQCKDAGEVWRARGFKTSWIAGFVTQVGLRIKEKQQAEVQASVSERALTIVNTEREDLDEYMKTVGARKVRRTTKLDAGNAAGFNSGRRAGSSVGLESGAVDGNERRRIG